MIELEEALERILGSLRPLPGESVPLETALHRIASETILAPISVPSFDNSSVDGYAVQSADATPATLESPVILARVGTSAAGDAPASPLAPGQCRRILTGAPLPPGADAVVMQEDTCPSEDGLRVHSSVRPWENVRFVGEDFQAGSALVTAGTRFGPTQVALLAAAGIAVVPVHRRPRLILFSTGNELRPPGIALEPGQIHDSNRFLLTALAVEAGADVVASRSIPDDLGEITRALADASTRADVIVTTGGVSVGDADHLKPAMLATGGTVDLWRISLKPGKPFAWGRIGNATWFGLPGNPVSAFVTWQLLVRPALRKLMGAESPHLPRIMGSLDQDVRNRGNRRHFMRVSLAADGKVRLAGSQASHIQSPLAQANALLDVPPETIWTAGRTVVVHWLG